MSNEFRERTGNYANEPRGDDGKKQNELLINNAESQIEPLGNHTEFQIEQRRKSGEVHAEPRAKREEFSEIDGRGGLKSSEENLKTACPQRLIQNSEYGHKSGVVVSTAENSVELSNEKIVEQLQRGLNEKDNMLLLWNKNQRFVKMVAIKYTGRAELEDLMQEGYIALYEAVRHYDAKQGVPFINYAAFWIRQGMQRYVVNCGSIVRIPVHAEEWVRKQKKMVSEYRKYYGCEPSDNVLCALLHISYEKLQSIKESVRMGQIRSLSERLGNEEGELIVGDSIGFCDDMEGDAVQRMDYQSMRERLWESLDSLDDKQAAVIRYRFLDNRMLKDIGEEYGVLRETVRGYQEKTIRELRKPSRCKKFRGYFEEYIAVASVHHIGVESFRQNW